MSLESAQFIHQLNASNPSGADRLKEGDDHIRMLKAALKATFPGITGPLAPSVTHTFLNTLAASMVPVGTITLFGGPEAPAGWAICNGQIVNKSDGSGKLTTPDLRGRVPVGKADNVELLAPLGQDRRTVTTEAGGTHTPLGKATIPAQAARTVSVTGQATTASTKIAATLTTRKVDDGGSASGIVTGVSLTDPGHTHAVDATAIVPALPAVDAPVAMEEVAAHSHALTLDVTQAALALHFIIKV